jgi:hypothetical protein
MCTVSGHIYGRKERKTLKYYEIIFEMLDVHYLAVFMHGFRYLFVAPCGTGDPAQALCLFNTYFYR